MSILVALTSEHFIPLVFIEAQLILKDLQRAVILHAMKMHLLPLLYAIHVRYIDDEMFSFSQLRRSIAKTFWQSVL